MSRTITPLQTRRSATAHAKRQRGSVLVAVLAIILVITFMVTRFMNEAVKDLEYRAIFNEPSDVRAFAYGPSSIARQLFRVLRSTVLLGHYELAEPRVDPSPEPV